MPKPSYNERALEILYSMMDKLKNLEADEYKMLSKKWEIVVISNLEKIIKELSEKEIKSEDQLFKLDLWKEFLVEAKTQVANYDRIAAGEILDYQFKFSKIGVDTTNKMLDVFNVRFNRLSPEKINSMIGLTKDESPLYELLKKSYPKTVDKVVDQLINSQALGIGPRETARLMTEAMGGNRTRALLIARTEQMRSNRESSLASMKESGVVARWEWIAEPDACDYCSEQNGKRFDLDEPMDTHPNCRCASLPIVE